MNGSQGRSDPLAGSAGAGASKVGVLTHYLRYSGANILVLLAGFVSFPALTRLLDNTQYGILGYYETWVMLAVAVAKLGAQHSIVRFYPYSNEPDRLGHFATNLFLLPLLFSLSLWAIAAVALLLVDRLGEAEFSGVFWLAVLMIPLLVFSSLVQMVMRASERSRILTVTRVGWRWFELAMVLSAVYFVQRSALSVYAGKILAAAIVLSYFFYWMRRNLAFSREATDLPAVWNSLRYGLPLVANEIATVALISVDRIMIKEITDDYAAVGVYSIGYSLALQVNILMHAALYEAFVPVANREFETVGAEAVRALKDRVLLPLTYASIGVAAMLLAVGSDALIALSGPDKVGSGIVFAIVGMSYALYPLIDVSGYGLLLRKRTGLVLAITFAATVLNVVLNLLWIPGYGVMGAVWATVASYLFLGACHYLFCPPELRRFPDRRALTISLGCALALLAVIHFSALFGLASPWARLPVAGLLFLVLYALPVWLLDARVRTMLRQWRGHRAAV